MSEAVFLAIYPLLVLVVEGIAWRLLWEKNYYVRRVE